ncbi:hypothetical protein [Shewanella sp. KCT]|uniref:hypothetical protein n=1 Tax=Shewanella sp. KCT TaxID=2569535 RepID=UPI0011837E23|nr:hypothetical protein [Shewanella sp. KCT]TVP09287.1 hypothetical protein AYI87_20085 [Shewanella sp. KCT]
MKGINTGLVVALLWLGVASQANAYTVYGQGTATCGTWIKERKQDGYKDMEYWILGYISAAGFYETDKLKKSDVHSFSVWIDNYCQKNPLAQIIDGAQALVRALK